MTRGTTEFIALALLVTATCARAGDVLVDDFSAPYLQRIEGVTASAGNAREVNAAIHTIDPWPRNVGNRRIPGDGERMVGAVQRYRKGGLPPPATVVPPGGAGTLSGAAVLFGATSPSGSTTTPAPASATR